MKTHCTRELQLDASRADPKRRSVPAVISSTYPVPRNGYNEVLLHGRENVDLSRAPLPLIESHDGARLNVGIVENLRLAGDKLRGDVVLGNSSRANEIWPDIEAGIVRNLSVGYTIHDYRERGSMIEVTSWQPHEVSLVSIPADPQAGTYRNFPMSEHNEGLPAADAGEPRLSRGQRRALNAPSAGDLAERAERERVSEILGIARAYARHKLDDIAHAAIESGDTVEQFRHDAMAKMSSQPLRTAELPPDARRVPGRERYSIARALRSMIDPRSTDAGYEREVSQEIARKTGRAARGIYMPLGELQNRTLSVGGAPALVGTEFAAPEFIDILRARSVVMTQNPMTMTGLSENVSIPRLTASATAQWIAGDGSDGITDTTPTFDAITLSPKTLGGLVLLSRKMLLQNVDAENIVLQDLGKVIATELDRAAINGSGASNQPTGILHTTGIATNTFAAAAPTFTEIVAMESALTGANVDASNAAYITTPALAGTMKTTLKAQYAAEMIWTANDDTGVGTVNGLRAFSSSNVPAKTVVLGNFSDFIVGFFGGVDLEIDPYWDFSKGTVAVRTFLSLDFGVRHPQSFAAFTTP